MGGNPAERSIVPASEGLGWGQERRAYPLSGRSGLGTGNQGGSQSTQWSIREDGQGEGAGTHWPSWKRPTPLLGIRGAWSRGPADWV